ncbi:MAG TPA: hypothetical protein VMH02_05920 [Verrucomicrobiae bacterium]|nr:hypothetical protein [Verrucomicrobiae bacterium]
MDRKDDDRPLHHDDADRFVRPRGVPRFIAIGIALLVVAALAWLRAVDPSLR